MIDRDPIVSEDELHAYVDGELPAARRGVVEAWLATHPDDAARVAAWRSQAELIRARYGGAAEEKLARRLETARPARRRCSRRSSPAARPAGSPATQRAPRRPICASLPPTRSTPTGSMWSKSVT